MKSGGGWTNLSLYVNGNPVAWKNESPSYEVRDSGTGGGAPVDSDLYLGYDPLAGTRFRGIVDEFRLYTTARTPDVVRGLLWFLHGANNVLIPRGVFYESSLYGKLNGSFDGSSPFAGGTAYGNSNTLSSNLNSRVIQIVIAKNLTLAEAWGILDLARTRNGTLNVTAFPFFATSPLSGGTRLQARGASRGLPPSIRRRGNKIGGRSTYARRAFLATRQTCVMCPASRGSADRLEIP